MTQPTSRSCRDVLVTVLCALLYAGAVAVYTVWSYREHKAALMEQIDSPSLQAARSLKYLLAEDFHDWLWARIPSPGRKNFRTADSSRSSASNPASPGCTPSPRPMDGSIFPPRPYRKKKP